MGYRSCLIGNRGKLPLTPFRSPSLQASLKGSQKGKALVANPLSLLRILAQIKPERLFFGLGCCEEQNSAVPLVGEVTLLPLNVQR